MTIARLMVPCSDLRQHRLAEYPHGRMPNRARRETAMWRSGIVFRPILLLTLHLAGDLAMQCCDMEESSLEGNCGDWWCTVECRVSSERDGDSLEGELSAGWMQWCWLFSRVSASLHSSEVRWSVRVLSLGSVNSGAVQVGRWCSRCLVWRELCSAA